MVSWATKQAEQLRKAGNTYFNKNRFGAAIDAYTEAITLCPNVPVYWTNRALCHHKRNDWKRVEEDCRKALQLENNSVKAHFMLGLALLKREAYEEGVKELEKALDLGRGEDPKSNMVGEIWQQLAKAKYKVWEQTSAQRLWELQSLKEACVVALKEKYFLDECQMDAAGANLEQLEALERVFMKAEEDVTASEVPDYLCCKITLEIFRDPVITRCGITYERSAILDYIRKGGNLDPFTRKPLVEQHLVPNLAIKEAVEAFLKKHGWAYKLN